MEETEWLPFVIVLCNLLHARQTPLPRTDESQKMAAAMEESLEQSQEEKEVSDVYKLPPPRLAQARILVKIDYLRLLPIIGTVACSPEYLYAWPRRCTLPQVFGDSPLLSRLREAEPSITSLESWPPEFVGFLVLEQRCISWYAGGRAYFEQAASKAVTELASQPGSFWPHLLALLRPLQREVQQAVYSMPPEQTDAIYIPPIFQQQAGTAVDIIDLCD